MKISVITATLNCKEKFLQTAASIQSQSFRDFEWIVIDGQSSDGTLDSIEKFKHLISYYCSEKDRGIASAWNKGIRNSCGDFILILNAGDTYTSEALQVFAEKSHKDKITCASAWIVNPTNNLKKVRHSKPHKLKFGMHVMHEWCLVPKRYYQSIGEYPEMKDSMDFCWFYKYFKKYGENGFNRIPQILGCYILDGHSYQNYKNGFIANKNIMIENGENTLLANMICIFYILNQKIRKLIFRI